MNISSSRIEKIPSTLVLHKHVYGADNRFSIMAVPLMNNHLGKCLGFIRRATYQATSEDCRWDFKPVSDLWPYIDPDSYSSYYVSSDDISKDQYNPDDQGKN